MTKVNQIQAAILELSGGAFHKLADAYLRSLGYQDINSLGSVIAKGKSKAGTPDAYVALPNGMYLFAEYTTQAKDFISKLHSDLDKCLDEKKTGISVDKIEAIVLCHTSTLKAKDHSSLVEKAAVAGVPLRVLGITSISNDLIIFYPGLIKDHLKIEIDTGQIVSLETFIENKENQKLTASLSTQFRFRDYELDQILKVLEHEDFVSITGNAGIGKTRLAIEACEKFQIAHPEFRIYCVQNRELDLFEDIRTYFSRPGDYLIFIDDANRISRFSYFLHLILDNAPGRRIKVLSTVRTYAVEQIRSELREYGLGDEIHLLPLKDEEISSFVEDEFGIINKNYLKRIVEISCGNPRLAVMAANVAKEANTLESIRDVTDLYDEYFRSIVDDLKNRGNEEIFKVGGLISFFRAIDKNVIFDDTSILDVFKIGVEEFWKVVHDLHALELVDIFENEVVKISDQVFATYVFYLALFKIKCIPFDDLLTHFFPQFRSNFEDSLFPALNSFDSSDLIDQMRPHVMGFWDDLKKNEKDSELFSLIEVFWFISPTSTLSTLRSRIDNLEPGHIPSEHWRFGEPDSWSERPEVLRILGSFRFSTRANFNIALELATKYVETRPSEIPDFLKLFRDTFGYTHHSYSQDYLMQHDVIDQLIRSTQDGASALFSRIFINIAKHYLGTRFQNYEDGRNHSVSIIDFELTKSENLFRLREKIWTHLIKLYNTGNYSQSIINLLDEFSVNNFGNSDTEVLLNDANVLVPFIEESLDPNKYNHWKIMISVREEFEGVGYQFAPDSGLRITNDLYSFIQILIDSWTIRRTMEMNFEEYRAFRSQRLAEEAEGYEKDDYLNLIDVLKPIYLELSIDERRRFRMGLLEMFLFLADSNPELFSQVIHAYLEDDDPFSLPPLRILSALIEIEELSTIENHLHKLAIRNLPKPISYLYNLFNQAPFGHPYLKWEISLHALLRSDQLDKPKIKRVYKLIQHASAQDLSINIEFLDKYKDLDPLLVPRVVRLLLGKVEQDPSYLFFLAPIFYPENQINKNLLVHFGSHFEVLKEAYFMLMSSRESVDSLGQNLSAMMSLEPSVIIEYIDWIIEDGKHIDRHNEITDYSFLWLREDFMSTMTTVLDSVLETDAKGGQYWQMGIEDFFKFRAGGQDAKIIENNQDEFLSSIISNHNTNRDIIKMISGPISRFEKDLRIKHIKLFLELNSDFDAFRNFALEPSSWSWSGSAVPLVEGRIEFLEQLLPMTSSSDYLLHREYLEGRIQYLRERRNNERKKDFIGI